MLKKVFVGMSGGVDSSLSAALLKEQGYDVTGVFIKVWQPDFIECTWREDRYDAMRVAAELDIPFVTLDLEKEYKEGVIDYMLREYAHGRTPNPDVMCNREVKFGAFWRWAKSNGADYIATGHYAITDNKNLFISKDDNKDQSYFLWSLRKDDLEHVLFPVGNMTKDDVRKEAYNRGLFTSGKKDSQGLCFVGTIDIKEFLKHELKVKEGKVMDTDGNVIGSHDGVIFYTIGERHGFKINKKSTNKTAYYIVAKDLEDNILTVSSEKPNNPTQGEFKLENTSWVNEEPKVDKTYEARARYRAPLSLVSLKKEGDNWFVSSTDKNFVPVSGQSLVVYEKNKCLGGAIIS